MRAVVLIYIFLPPLLADVLLNAVFLLDPSTFSASVFESVVTSLIGQDASTTIVSVQPDIITGLEARRTYFPGDKSIYTFQLIHITRVQASISAGGNHTVAMDMLNASLPSACLRAGIGLMAIDSIATGDAPTSGWTQLANQLLNLPPLVAPLALGAWFLSMLSCGICWIVYCCCKRPAEAVPVAHVIAQEEVVPSVHEEPEHLPVENHEPSAPPAHLLPPSDSSNGTQPDHQPAVPPPPPPAAPSNPPAAPSSSNPPESHNPGQKTVAPPSSNNVVPPSSPNAAPPSSNSTSLDAIMRSVQLDPIPSSPPPLIIPLKPTVIRLPSEWAM